LGSGSLRLLAQQGNASNQTYTSGNIIAVDNALIDWVPGANDRVTSIADVNVQSTGGALLDAQLKINVPNLRSILEAGVLSITGTNGVAGTNAGAIINVNATAINTNLTSGISSGFSAARLSGSSDTRLTKWGS